MMDDESTQLNTSLGQVDDLDIDNLESDNDADLKDQDKFKGVNLNAQTTVQRRYDNRAERMKWLNDDGNTGKYKIAMEQRPRKEFVEQKYKESHDRVKRLKHETKLNEP